MRSQKDDEEATRVRKEQDELLQKDTETRQRILDLLGDVEKERELKLGDELLQTSEKLHSEHSVAHEERD